MSECFSQSAASVPENLSASLSRGWKKWRWDQDHHPLKLYWWPLTLKGTVPEGAHRAADQQTDILTEGTPMFLCQTASENSWFSFYWKWSCWWQTLPSDYCWQAAWLTYCKGEDNSNTVVLWNQCYPRSSNVGEKLYHNARWTLIDPVKQIQHFSRFMTHRSHSWLNSNNKVTAPAPTLLPLF